MTANTKIGIGIVHCYTNSPEGAGFRLVYKSDEGEWSSIIDDTGDVFNFVEINNEETTILKMIRISEDGWYMCSMKPVPGRGGEYRASWVYFPSSLELSNRDIKDIIEDAENQIKGKRPDKDKLQETIQTYRKPNKKGKLLYTIPPTQNGYAFFDTSGNTNIFDLYSHIYQKEFFKYKWVLLMDKSSLKFKKEDAVQDISDKEIVESYVSIKPNANDLWGFTPNLDGEKFCSPVQIMEGEALSIVFKKDGYMPLEKEIRSQNDFSISKDDCKRYFYKRQFVAYDEKTRKRIPISSNDSIRPLNASEDETKSKWIFLEQSLEKVEFEVKAEGYHPKKCTLNLRDKSLDDDILVKLEPESHEYVFVLPLDRSVVKDCETVEITIHSQYVIKESPLKYYKCNGTPREGGSPNRLSAVVQSTNDYSTNNGKNNKEYNGNKEKVTKAQGSKPTCESPKSHGSNGVTKEKPNHTLLNHIKKRKIVFLFIILVVAVVEICCIVYFKPFEDTKMEQTTVMNTSSEASSFADSTDSTTNSDEWREAYNYLQKDTTKIYKNGMDNCSDLKGLYDILNEYRFEDFIDYIDRHEHKREILKINVWERLYEKAKEIGINQDGIQKYNDENQEQSITFEIYFQVIERFSPSRADQPEQPRNGTSLTGKGNTASSNTNPQDGNSYYVCIH